MRNKAIPFFLLLLLFLVAHIGKGQMGYMGQKNELGVDLFNAGYQGAYEFEYKRSIHKHFGLILHAGYFASKKSYKDLDRSLASGLDPKSSLTTGPVVGLGLGRNKEGAGMAYPIGYCISYGFKRAWLNIEDRYFGLEKPLEYEHNVTQIYLRFSRNYNVKDMWNLQLGLRTGLMISKAKFRTESLVKEKLSPLRVIPAKHPFSKGGTYQLQRFQVGNGNVWRFFLMPVIRASYLF